jgi:hypothetical protein
LFHNFLLFSKILFNTHNNANKNIFASSPEVRLFFDFLWIVSEDAQFLSLRLLSEFFGAHAHMPCESPVKSGLGVETHFIENL